MEHTGGTVIMMRNASNSEGILFIACIVMVVLIVYELGSACKFFKSNNTSIESCEKLLNQHDLMRLITKIFGFFLLIMLGIFARDWFYMPQKSQEEACLSIIWAERKEIFTEWFIGGGIWIFSSVLLDVLYYLVKIKSNNFTLQHIRTRNMQ